MKKVFLSQAVFLSFFIVSCNIGTAPVIRRSGEPVSLINTSPSPSPSPTASGAKTVVDESEKIAFMSNRAGFWDIYNMNTDGSNIQRLTKDDMRTPFSFSISPDGKRMAYISDKTGNSDLWVMDMTSKSTIQVTDTPSGDEGSPTWSSDSNSIVFHSNFDDKVNFYQIYQVNYPINDKGKNTLQVLVPETTTNALHPSFSPSGTKLLYSISDDAGLTLLHVYDYETRKDVIVTKKEDQPINGSWNSNSNKVIYWTNSNGLFQVNSDGTGNIQVGSIKNVKGTPYYSPDGKKIAFARGYGFADDYDIWSMDNDGRNPKKLTTEGGISLYWYKVAKNILNPIPTTSSNPSVIQPTSAPYIDPNDPVINP